MSARPAPAGADSLWLVYTCEGARVRAGRRLRAGDALSIGGRGAASVAGGSHGRLRLAGPQLAQRLARLLGHLTLFGRLPVGNHLPLQLRLRDRQTRTGGSVRWCTEDVRK